MTSQLVSDVLQEYGTATRSILFQYLPKAEPRRYLYDLISDYPLRGGRAMRPSLCIATARAFGADLADAVHTAVSIELLHNAMLIHDDVQDESELRRGKPALHVEHGVPLAINAGDALSLLAMRPLLDSGERLGPQLALRLLRETERMARESAEGQALELGWRRDNSTAVCEADYLIMVMKKTCWLATIHPTRTGALIGTGGAMDVERFVRFGFLLGAAFQIQDDLLNLVGDASRYGKELSGDLAEGKRTLMLIRLFERLLPADLDRLRSFLGRPRGERTLSELQWVRDQMDQHDCIEYARRVAHALAGAAQHEAGALLGHLPDSRDKQFLAALPAWVIART